MTGGASTEPIAVVFLVGLVAAVKGREVLRGHWDAWMDPDPQEVLRDRYANGELSLAEYERELDMLLDESNQRIKDHLTRVDGIGDAVATEVALSFRSLGELKRADRADLLGVDDVGPKRADDILENVREL